MENIIASIEMFTIRRSEHNRSSDRQCLEKRITEIRHKWRRGPTSFKEIVEIAYLITDLTEIAEDTPQFHSHRSLAYWIYTNSHEFWAPEDNTDVWNHLQYIFNEFMRYGVQSRAKELHLKQMVSTRDKLEPVSFVDVKHGMFHGHLFRVRKCITKTAKEKTFSLGSDRESRACATYLLRFFFVFT